MGFDTPWIKANMKDGTLTIFPGQGKSVVSVTDTPEDAKRIQSILKMARDRFVKSVIVTLKSIKPLTNERGRGGMMEYFGKGCKFLCAKWEDEQMYTDESYKENTPVLMLCIHPWNEVRNEEGNCRRNICPFVLEGKESKRGANR